MSGLGRALQSARAITLVAIAALAATGAFAQQLPSGANPSPAWGNGVLITGVFDVGYASLNYKGANKVTSVAHNGSSTSQIDFAGVFDLGGGMKADFFFENDIVPTSYVTNPGSGSFNGTYASSTATTTTNSTGVQAVSSWGNGQVKAGIGGGFGYLAIGAVNNAGLDFNQYTNPFGTSYGGGYGITMATVGNGYGSSAKVRWDNSVRYVSPSFGNTVASLTYRAKNDTAANSMASTSAGLQAQSGVQELALIYRNGPLNLIAVNQIDDANGTRNVAGALNASGKKYTANSIGGNYTMGAFTGYYGYQTMKNDTTTDNKASRYALKYMATPDLALSVVSSSVKVASGAKTSLTGLGADYALSKTVALYAKYEAVTDDALLLASTEANGGTDAAPATAVGPITAGFATPAAFADHKRTRTMVGLRVGF